MVEGSRCFGEAGERLLVYVTMETGVVVKDVDLSMGWEGDFILRNPVAGGDHCISVASHDCRQRRNGQCTEIAPKSRPTVGPISRGKVEHFWGITTGPYSSYWCTIDQIKWSYIH